MTTEDRRHEEGKDGRKFTNLRENITWDRRETRFRVVFSCFVSFVFGSFGVLGCFFKSFFGSFEALWKASLGSALFWLA